MKNSLLNVRNIGIIFFSCLITPGLGNAQKLANKQENSLFLPLPPKIDGKITEFKQFQAYNSATEIFYTLANNSNGFYLAIKAERPLIIQKILSNGITVSAQNNKRDFGKVSITYPIVNYNQARALVAEVNKTTPPVADSILNIFNRRIINAAKIIGVSGLSHIQDSVISVYNEYDINACMRFDDKKCLVYELLLPIKYLMNGANGSANKLIYTITLNGADSKRPKMKISEDGNYVKIEGGDGPALELKLDASLRAIVAVSYPTVLSGEYTLAK
nr:hypothetical protein [uncultured Mucilaginibacter sp.]